MPIATLILPLLASSGVWLYPPTEPKLPQETHLLKFERPQKWTITARATLLARQSVSDAGTKQQRNGRTVTERSLALDAWTFDQFVVIQPLVRGTASSVSDEALPIGSLELDDIEVDTEPTIIGPYQSQALYARWECTQAGTAREMELRQTMAYTSYETVFDEDAAMKLGWPAEWPPEAQSTFLPQQYVSLDPAGNPFDSSDKTVAELLAKWTNGQDPKSIAPLQLAKWLAGNVQQHVNITLAGTTSRRQQDSELTTASGTASGIEVKSAPETALTGKGTMHDATVLLAAIYREAGLPARIVIGYQEREDDGSRKLNNHERLRSWVEFAMYDEAHNELTWVPVDVARMRERSSRMQPMNQKWKYFGTHDELDDVVPIALHFHPPTDVRSYAAAALFGITMVPAAPDFAVQYVSFEQTRTPKSPG